MATPKPTPTDVVDTPPATLAEARLAMQAAAESVPRAQTGTIGTRSYKYADLGAVAAVANPLLSRFGLVFTGSTRYSTDAGNYEYAGKLTHVASGEESEESTLPLLGRTAQEFGSWITYARRYTLGTITGLITEEDDDGAAASHQQPPRQQRPARQGATPDQITELQKALHAVGLVGQEAGQEVCAFLDRAIAGWHDITPDEATRATQHFQSLAPKGGEQA